MGFDPISLAAAGATLAAGGISALSSHMQGKTAKKASSANAESMDRQAAQVEADAAANMLRQRRNQNTAVAEQAARAGASGLTGEGSGSAAQQVVMRSVEADIADMGTKAQREASSLRHQADLTRWEGGQQHRSGNVVALGTVLRSAASAGRSLYGSSGSGVQRKPTQTVKK